MVNCYNYDLPKTDILNLCKKILINLDYEIDIFAPEINLILTESTKLRKDYRGSIYLNPFYYKYILYIKITDKIEIHITGKRSIFDRNFLSFIDKKRIIKH